MKSMKINSSEIIANSKTSLLNLAEQLNKIKIVVFQELDLYMDDFRSIATFNNNIKLSKTTFPIIYTIEILDTKTKNDLINLFYHFKEENKSRVKNENRINHSKYNGSDSNYLYVGSSINDFKSRLKDHLGVKKGLRTYGLHLSKWDKDINYSIRIKTYEIKHINDLENKRNLVEIIEQQFWDTLKPVFGKRSGLL